MNIKKIFHKVYSRLKYYKERIYSTHSILLLVRPAKEFAAEMQHKPCPGEFRAVTEDNIHDCAAFEDADHYVPVYRSMLEKGDYVVFGYLNGVCVFRHAMQKSGDISFAHSTIRQLKENEAYVHYGFCAPEARGQGFHSESIYRFCKDNPSHTLYAMVEEKNIASLRGCVRNGFHIHSRLTVKYRFFRRWFKETPISPAEAEAILAGKPKQRG